MYGMQEMGTAFQQLEGAGWQALGGLLSAGRKPKIPAFVPVEYGAEQQRAISNNIAAFQPASELTAMTNRFNQAQLNEMLRAAIPDYEAITQRASRNIASELAGEIPADVQRQINRKAAAASLAGGYGGSGMARNLEARDLGLTSYAITQQGLNSAMQWIANSRQYRTPAQMDITSMFITPQQQVAQTTYERDMKFQRDLLAAGVAAMPDPQRAAIGGALINFGGARMASAGSGGGGGMDFSSMFGSFGGGAG